MHAEYSSLLWEELENKEYRQGYVDAQYSVEMPFQINALRKARGWTQAELADRAGLSRSYISKIEQAGYGPSSLKTLKKLCGAFDVGLHLTFISFSELVQKSVVFNIETFDVTPFSEDSLHSEISLHSEDFCGHEREREVPSDVEVQPYFFSVPVKRKRVTVWIAYKSESTELEPPTQPKEELWHDPHLHHLIP